MLFNSFQFLIFFPLVTVLFFLLPHRFRWMHLLLASCVFYAAFIPAYILILFATIIIDYIAGIWIEKASGKKRKWLLGLSIVTNVGILCVFKYYNFFIENINVLLLQTGWEVKSLPYLDIILPIGLSFHTFQAMSYTIEVYRGHQPAERHFGIYALYVMFYPQLVAGPIERPQNLLHQFHEEKHFDYNQVVSGLRLMMWGLFKKVVIADRLALFTDPVFNNPHGYSPILLVVATLFFAIQIFCDFSGYSDMAIGSARVMGFKLMKNFDKPYHSKTISEFWSRWHISLSTWFKDYLYISLGGNRVSVPRWYFNLFFVFLVSGFWHGANWTFIVWGALHGFYLIFGNSTAFLRNKISEYAGIVRIKWLYTGIQVATTFFLVVIAWVFFRATSISDAVYILGQFPTAILDVAGLLSGQAVSGTGMPVDRVTLLLSVAGILLLEMVHLFQLKWNVSAILDSMPVAVRWAVYYTSVLVIIFLGVFESRQFIYFQF